MSDNKQQEISEAKRQELEAKETAKRLTEEEAEVETAPDPEQASIMPVEDIFSLIESKVAEKLGEMEVDKGETVTLDDIKTAIAEQEPTAIEVTGVDEAEIKAKMEGLETKLKEEARGEFQKVGIALAKTEGAVGELAQKGLAKVAEVQGEVDSKLNEALKAGLGKIAEAESKMAKQAVAEVDKAKEDAKAFLEHKLAEHKKEMADLMDAKIKAAFDQWGK